MMWFIIVPIFLKKHFLLQFMYTYRYYVYKKNSYSATRFIAGQQTYITIALSREKFACGSSPLLFHRVILKYNIYVNSFYL